MFDWAKINIDNVAKRKIMGLLHVKPIFGGFTNAFNWCFAQPLGIHPCYAEMYAIILAIEASVSHGWCT